MEPLKLRCWFTGLPAEPPTDILAMPPATVGRIVHNIVEEIMTILHRIIHFPKPEEMEEAGAGCVCLAGCDSFLLQRATEEMLHKQKTLDLTAAAGHLRCQGHISGCLHWQSRICTRCSCPPQMSPSTNRLCIHQLGAFY